MYPATRTEAHGFHRKVQIGDPVFDTSRTAECNNNNLVSCIRGDKAGGISQRRAINVSACVASVPPFVTYFSNSVSVFVSAAST